MAKLLFLALLLASALQATAADRILILTKTAAYREDNIAPARLALKKYLEQKGLAVDTSENAGLFTDSSLAKYKAVVFLKTSGDILNPAQQTAFEKFFLAGGGFVAIHSALDTEYDWAFYGKLIGGAYFMSLGGNQKTQETILVEDSTDISTAMLPRPWHRTDEIYNFKANPRLSKDPIVHVLLTVDGKSYPKGVPGEDHPMSWYDSYQGGHAWVTAMGHTTESYSDPLFLGHVWGGMQYAMGRTATAAVFSAPDPRTSGVIGKHAARRYQASGRTVPAGEKGASPRLLRP